MKTIQLYKWENTNHVAKWEERFGYVTEEYRFDQRGFTVCDGYAKEYVLPEGFEYAESNCGSMEFYDKNGRTYQLRHSGGSPTLVGDLGSFKMEERGKTKC